MRDADDACALESAIARLEGSSTKPIRDLLRLASAWTRPEPCRAGFGGQLPRRAPTERAVAAVARWLSHPDREVRHAALTTLSALEEPHGLRSELVAAFLADPDPVLRILAARTLRRTARETDRESLEKALADPIYSVRWYAASALIRIGAHANVADVLAAAVPSTLGVLADLHFDEWLGVVRELIRVTRNDGLLPLFRDALERHGAMTEERREALASLRPTPPS